MPETTPTEGIWDITTETSRYLLDLDDMLITRLPKVAGTGELAPDTRALRGDTQPLAVLQVEPITLGQPMLLALRVADDPTVVTIRQSTRVCAIRRHHAAHASRDTRRAIGPSSKGTWMVHTHTSDHRWDLDHHTYTRLPGPAATAMPHDGQALAILDVQIWPEVGSVSYILCQEPDDPATELWRISAPITSIQRVHDDKPTPSGSA